MDHSSQHLKSAKSDPAFWRLLLLTFVIGLVAISNQSLWIDEAVTAYQASLPSLKECWRQQIVDRGSELQMPLFMSFLWIWEKVFATTEWTLRLSNLPWLLLGGAAWLKASSHHKNLRVGVLLAILFSPFLWFYLNEARPYTMQLGGSLLVFAALYRLGSQTPLSKTAERRWAMGLAAGIFIVCASSMLGVIWVAAALCTAWVVFGSKRTLTLLKTFPIIWLVALTSLVGLGIYFLWTFQHGARASGAAGTDFKNLVFIGYEFFGFSGLGPGRLELREAGLQSLRPYVVLFAFYAVFLSAVLATAWRDKDRIAQNKKLLWPAICLSAATIILLAMGHLAHFRVLGRHFTPLIVVILFVLGFGVAELIFSRGILAKSVALLFLGLNLFSCLSLRFAARHEKDDYRSAARTAKAELATGKTVWWNADKASALYYRVPIASESKPKTALLVRNPDRTFLSEFAFKIPNVVISTKPDIYDRENALRIFLKDENYAVLTNFPAFKIWEKAPR